MSLRDFLRLLGHVVFALTTLFILYRRLLRNYDPRDRLLTALQALAGYALEMVFFLGLWQWDSGATLMAGLWAVVLWGAAHLLGMALHAGLILAFVRI